MAEIHMRVQSDQTLSEYWQARLAQHRALGHETFGWHECEQEPCVSCQGEFDGTRFKDEGRVHA